MSTVPTQLPSRLPESSGNLFQLIKQCQAEAEAAGIKLTKLSIGQPSGPAFLSARQAAAEAVMSSAESMHEYQDNGSPGSPGFARLFVGHHVETDLSIYSDRIGYLPTPGLKSMLGLIPLACGASRYSHAIAVGTTTDPGYPTPAFWSNNLPGVVHQAIKLSPANGFLFTNDSLKVAGLGTYDLIMMNYPHNPSGKAASREWLTQLCAFAEENGIRIFNDGAYAMLAHSGVHTTLTDVAVNFPNLSWTEGFSASKAIGNGTGWRIGAIVGSSDFVADIARIKGDADSGFFAPAAVGVLHALQHDMASIVQNREMYGSRLDLLMDILNNCGMKPAVKPDAGFFTLWQVPKKAFGQVIETAEQFNRLMINKTGVVGVHFNPGYIRYAVTSDIFSLRGEIKDAFEAANVSY